METAEEYVEQIMLDDRSGFVSETPTVYEDLRIERVYEFADGAVIKYEWRDISLNEFNHRFTLVTPPKPNPSKLAAGIIEVIGYP